MPYTEPHPKFVTGQAARAKYWTREQFGTAVNAISQVCAYRVYGRKPPYEAYSKADLDLYWDHTTFTPCDWIRFALRPDRATNAHPRASVQKLRMQRWYRFSRWLKRAYPDDRPGTTSGMPEIFFPE